MAFLIDERKIKIDTRSKSQTINVYVDNAESGVYDPKIRIMGKSNFVTEQTLKDKTFSSIQEMVNFLREKHGAKIEDTTQSSAAGRPQQHRTLIPIDKAWVENIIPEIEKAINSVIDEFITLPYLHRVEHSIHCELYSKLSHSRILNQLIDFGCCTTGAIHKEWPETIPRPEKNNRRGNFDIAILGPIESYTKPVTLRDFRLGHLEPAVVIEVGLDYGIDHLKGDVKKFRNSKVKHGYLLHLARQTGVSQDGVDEYITTLIENENQENAPRIAYAKVILDGISYRKLGNNTITTIQPETQGQPLV